MRRWILAGLVLTLAASLVWPAQKKRKKKEDEEEITQTLEVLKDPPSAVVAEAERLVFHVTPLSPKGLLSQQTRDGLRAVLRLAAGAAPVRLRAFVAGTGDVRRVSAIVSETFTERRLPLPAVSVIQVGGLPMEGAQVVIESISASRKVVNPNGLAFLSGQAASHPDPAAPIAPLLERSLADLKKGIDAVSDPGNVLRVTCLLTSLDGAMESRAKIAAAFPQAAVNLVQIQRGPFQGLAECEAVARLREKPSQPLVLLNPEGLSRSPHYTQVALVAPGRLALSGTQLGFRAQESDIRLAFVRLGKAMESVNASLKNVAMSSIYPLSNSIADRVRAVRFEFYDKERPPASTMVPFEGLPSMDASFGVDVIAVMP